MSEKELEQAEKKYKSRYNKWTEALQHITVWSRQDINHTLMILSGYNTAPALPCSETFDHTMIYLYHKPRVPIISPREKVDDSTIPVHHARGEGEIANIKNVREYTGLKIIWMVI